MGTLTYPFTLTAGQPENVNQLNSNLAAVATVLNGSVDATNLATSAKPVTIRGPYQTISEATFGVLTSALVSTATIYLPTMAATAKSGDSLTTTSPYVLLPFDPAAYAVSGLTLRLRVVASLATNATAPAMNFTYGLYPVTVAGGASAVVVTAGTVTSGSTVTRTTPSASTGYTDASSDFAAPSAGVYALGFAASAQMAGNSGAVASIRLEYHHV